MRARMLALLVLVITAAAVAGITGLDPSAIERTSSLQPDRSSKLVCIPSADSSTIAASGAGTAGVLGQDRTPVSEWLTVDGQSEPQVVTGDVGLAGVAASVDAPRADWSGCVPARAEGTILLPGTDDAELLLVNSDPGDASVDLTLHGPDGEIAAVGARGIAISAGATRVIALSVIADVEGPVAVSYRASRGRASLVARTTGPGVLDSARSSDAATRHVLTGVPSGQDEVSLLLANPSDARATVAVTAIGASAAYTPPGGEAVSVPPRSTVALQVGGALAGEASGFELDSDVAVVSSLALGAPDRATVEPATPGTDLRAASPSEATLVLTNPGDGDTTARVTVDGSEQEVDVRAGTTASLGVGPGAVQVVSEDPVAGVLVVAGADGTAAQVLTAADAGTATLDAIVDPTLR